MERSQREETASQPAGVPALKNFTIPRKKRTSGQVLLEPCSQDSRDYSLIHTKLRDANLDTRTGRADAWIWRDVALVHNEELLKHFSEKRAEMRAKGRHGREMEESFCFLAASDQTAGQVCEQGLRVGSTVQHALGKPSLGVYLFKHVDVALKSNSSATKLIVFKVLYGKVKKVAASVDWTKTQDPTVSFDCHVCKDAASHRDALHQQVLASAVFLFDYNGEQELSERPRQCLPYAVVSFVPASGAVPSVSANLPLSPSAPPAGQVHDRFKACTVAERRRKGNSATVTFKRFGAPDYPPQSQNTETQNTESLQPKRHPDSDSSVPAVDHTPPSQNLLGRKALTHARNDRKWDSISQSPLDKMSTIVYSSRSVRDPRLSRQEAKRQSGSSEAEDNNTQPAGHSKEDELAGNTCESNMDQRNAQRDLCFSLKASMSDQRVPVPALPSMKLFKMKFQKYSAYFRLSEEERRQKICSHEHMSPEQKQELSDRIHFYEAYYQKYKKGLLFQKVTNETPGLPLRERRDNKHQSEQAEQHQTASVSDHNDAWSAKHIHETRHPGHPKPSAVMLTEEGQDHQEHPKACLIQSPEQSLVLGSLNPNLTNEKVDAESVRFDLKRASAFTGRSNEAPGNDSSGCECDLSRRAAEDMQGTGSAPAADSDARPGTESSLVCANNISAMDIASCVEVSTLDSCNLSLQQKQNGESGSGAQETDSFRRGKLCERNAETSPELDMETVQLYARLQLDQLLPSTDQKAVFSSRAYLTPRVMGRPADNVYKTKNESKDHSEAAANLLTRCSEDLHLIIVTVEANNMSGHEREMISLSERFSKIKGLQKPSGARNNKEIRSPGTQTCEGLKEAVSCNSRLIQRLAQSFSKAKIYVKSKSLSRRTARVKKQHTVRSRKRRKYAKKKHFWKAKKNLKSETENNEIKVSSNSLSLSPEKDQDPDYNSRSVSHTSEADNDRQEANAFRSKPQDQCSPAVSVIRKHPAPSTASHTIPESKEGAIRPTDLCSEDLSSSVYTVKTSEVMTTVMDEQVRTAKNISDQHKTALTASTSKEDGSITESKENRLNPVSKEHFSISDSGEDASESSRVHDDEASKTHRDITTNNSHRTEQTTMKAEAEVMETVSNAAETETIKNELNTSSLNVEARAREHVPANIPNINQSCLKIYTNTSNGSSVWRIDPEPETRLEALRCASSDVVDLTVDDPGSSGQREISAEHAQTSNSDPLAYAKSPRAHILRDKCDLSRPERNKKDDVNSPETQLISKLRDYLTKFESTVKKQEAVNEDLKERPLVWITLDSTAHKQQLFEKGQYCMVNLPCLIPPGSDDPASDNSIDCSKTPAQPRRCPRGKRAQTGADVCLLVPVESKRGRPSSQSKCSRRSRRSSVTSVSPDSTSVLDTIKDTSPRPLPQANDPNTVSPNISISNTCDAQLQMQSKSTTGQQNPSAHLDSSCQRKSQENQNTIEIIDDGDVSSTFADNEYSISDISNTLKLADETTSLPELASLQSKCKSMLQHFISSFERDQKVPFNQSFVSMCLILEQYLDHPPPQVDLKYEAVNSYLELQMMMEAWQFIENKMNFMRGKPTFRSLLWYDPSLYGELYKGEVGFQQQSSLFASFQSILAQEGYSKLQEYYTAVSSLHQQLYAAPDASYYMYLKSKRELLEAEAALRNPQDIKSFFLSVPVAAMINFGDSLERLEKVHKVLMTFVETPSDRLPGTFDVGKAEHLSIACRYLQEKALFLKSCKVISKISWFGIEHLLYDASKILVWQDMRHSAPSEVLKTYKNSNPQIIFGVTESGVALVNKVEQPPPSTDGAETKVKSDAARKRRGLQLWMSSQPSAAQSTKADKEVAYNMAKRRASHPPVTQCNMTSDGANLLFQTTPASRVQIPRPYYSVPRRDPGRWGTAGGLSADWTASSPSTSHAHSETLPHLLPKGRVTDVQRAHWPSVSAPRAALRGDACVTRPPFDSVKYRHNSPAAHRPVLSQAQEQHFSLAMTQPYNLANCPLNANVAAAPALSVQPLTHVPVPVPRRITAVHYPYFLLNGQTYTSGSAAAIPPETRYYPNTMGQ